MRVSAYSVLSDEDKHDRFLEVLSEYNISSKPKHVRGKHDYPFLEFQLPKKWSEDEIRCFLHALDFVILDCG